jgi:hypothetical protein
MKSHIEMQVTHGGLARPWRQADSSEHVQNAWIREELS